MPGRRQPSRPADRPAPAPPGPVRSVSRPPGRPAGRPCAALPVRSLAAARHPVSHSPCRERRPVPAAAARRGRWPADSEWVRHLGSLARRPGSAAAATLGAGPAAAPAPAAAASLAPVQLNDVVQRRIHFVGHGGRGDRPRSSRVARRRVTSSALAGFPVPRPQSDRGLAAGLRRLRGRGRACALNQGLGGRLLRDAELRPQAFIYLPRPGRAAN